MTTFSEPHLEHLGRFARSAALAVDAPGHAWVKEFVRDYLGPQYATRSVVRECAHRFLNEQDALFGLTLDLAHAARGIIEPADVRMLLERTPVLPGPAATVDDVQLWRFRDLVLREYDRATVMRILESALHSVAQETVRELEIDQHTEASFGYLLEVRTEYNVEEIVDRLSRPVPDSLAAPLAELLADLHTDDPRDAIFAAAALRSPEVSRRFDDRSAIAILWRAWELGIDQGPVAVLKASANPDLTDRFGQEMFAFVSRGLRANDLTIRTAAIRALAAPTVRAHRGNTAAAVLLGALSNRSWRVVDSALTVVADQGFEVLGRHGRAQFLRRLDAWLASTDGDRQGYALDALERPSIREAVGPLATSRALNALADSDRERTRVRVSRLRYEHTRGPSYLRQDVEPELEWTAHRHGSETLTGIVRAALGYDAAAVGLPDAQAVTTWRDLDRTFDVPFDLPHEAAAVDGLRIGEFVVRVLRTPREIIDNGHRQRNCTNLWGPKLRDGRHILTAVLDEEGRTVCNADWVRTPKQWRIGQVLGKCNDPRVDRDLKAALVRATDLVNQHAERNVDIGLER